MNNYQLFVDTYQDGGNIDVGILAQNGVAGIMSRINNVDSNGNFIADTGFQSQYNATLNGGLIPLIYFVYNPWKTGQDNFDYLQSVMPAGAKAVAVDIELARLGYSPSSYATDVQTFIDLCNLHYNTAIYTAEWFLSNLSKWPTDVEYWWAEYPAIFYPSSSQNCTWDTIKNELSGFQLPLNNSQVPSKLWGWQFTGDKLIPSGCQKPMDVSVFYGSLQDLQNWAGGQYAPVTPPAPQPSYTPTLVDQQNWNGALYQKFNVNIIRPTGLDNVNYYVITTPVDLIEDIVFDNQVAVAETSWFTSHHDVTFATNGWDGFYTDKNGTHLTGFAAYHGQAFGKLGLEETIFIDQNMNFTLDVVPHTIWSACSFPNLLIQDGVILQTDKTDDDVRARTAWGISRDGKTLYSLVVDGLDYYSHHGMNYKEVQSLLLSLGCYLAWMSDGGGSTTLCKKNADGSATVINQPSGENADGQRSVAIHCGIKMKQAVSVPPTPIPQSTTTVSLSKTINVLNDGSYSIK